MNQQLPSLPYAGTSGYSGTDTSERRARTEDANGITSERQKAVLLHLHNVGTGGATWKELADAHGWHHGQASGALSNLHRGGYIHRLTVVRNRCKVYVHPLHVHGRQTENPTTRRTPDPAILRLADILKTTRDGQSVTLDAYTSDLLRDYLSETLK